MDGNPLRRLSRYVVEPLSQIWLLLRESMSLRRLIVNRFTVLLLVIVLVTTGAGAYMDGNSGERLTGTVVTADGSPVENATVTLQVVGIENEIASREAVTNGSGQFVMEDYSGSGDSGIDLRFTVVTEDGSESGPHFRHTLFPGQTLDVRLRIGDEQTIG